MIKTSIFLIIRLSFAQGNKLTFSDCKRKASAKQISQVSIMAGNFFSLDERKKLSLHKTGRKVGGAIFAMIMMRLAIVVIFTWSETPRSKRGRYSSCSVSCWSVF